MACAHANELQLRCCNLLQLSHISHMFSHPVALNQTSNTASKAPRLQLQQESGHWREEIARKCPRVPGSGVHFQHAPMWKQLRKRLEVQRVVVSPEDSPEYPGHQAAQISPDDMSFFWVLELRSEDSEDSEDSAVSDSKLSLSALSIFEFL